MSENDPTVGVQRGDILETQNITPKMYGIRTGQRSTKILATVVFKMTKLRPIVNGQIVDGKTLLFGYAPPSIIVLGTLAKGVQY